MKLCKLDNPEAHRMCAWMVEALNRKGAAEFSFDLASGPGYANLQVEARGEGDRLIERTTFRGKPSD